MSDERCCPWCAEYLVQREDEPDDAFANRKYCNKVHSGLHAGEIMKQRNKKNPPKPRKLIMNDYTAPMPFDSGRKY